MNLQVRLLEDALPVGVKICGTTIWPMAVIVVLLYSLESNMSWKRIFCWFKGHHKQLIMHEEDWPPPGEPVTSEHYHYECSCCGKTWNSFAEAMNVDLVVVNVE